MDDLECGTISPGAVGIQSSEYNAVCSWPFADSYVTRLLASDLPQRTAFGPGRVWVYCDPSNEIVGFGSMDICQEFHYLTGGKFHAYIPLLAVHPDKQGLGL